ncbi:MAG: hypothetical protein FWC22_06465 [Treponema sp.]|nr:hypothetical protein [Treponema sp.]
MTSNKTGFRFRIIVSILLIFTVHSVFGSMPDNEAIYENAPVFPHMLFMDAVNYWVKTENSKPYWVSTRDEIDNFNRMSANQISLLLNNDILAYYGHPNSRNMGILGRYSINELDQMMTEKAAEYKAVNGGRNVRKALYIIYGTVWPQGRIGTIEHKTLMEYIEYGMKNDILIYIDHQIGRYDPIDSLKVMLPYLRYPNVHLALDPEWRTTKPMTEIGHLTAEEIIRAQQIMEDYLIENNLPGERMLVIHQFNHGMIKDREKVRSDFNRVRLIHCADGFGSPLLKRNTYNYNALAANMPLKAFKLFYNFEIPGAGYDNPIMSPEDVYALKPRPYIIMYQ